MTAATKPTVPPSVITELQITLSRLRLARTVGDQEEALIRERRLNWLIENHLPRWIQTHLPQ